jgi:hypothetical protein
MVGTLNFSVRAGRSGFDIDMADAQIMQMRMEVGLEFVPVVCANNTDQEREPRNDVIDKGDGIILGVPIIDFQGSDPRNIVNSHILKSPDGRAVGLLDCQEFHINLDMVSGNLFFVSVGDNGPPLCVLEKTIQAMVLENPSMLPEKTFMPWQLSDTKQSSVDPDIMFGN